MAKTFVTFPLSKQTDTEFQAALAVLAGMPQSWHVVGIRRDEVTQSGQKVPICVIDVET